jgi:adenylate kinase family enzyme
VRPSLDGIVKRVAILGRGGAGKSVLAQKLSSILDLPVIELDSIFWQPGPRPTPEQEWAEIQRGLVARDRWIIDGDLGPYDTSLDLRLHAAETVIVLDFPLWRCVWHALRRSRETREFWAWVLRYRRDTLPTITTAVATYAQHVDVHVLRNPRQVRRFLGRFRAESPPDLV